MSILDFDAEFIPASKPKRGKKLLVASLVTVVALGALGAGGAIFMHQRETKHRIQAAPAAAESFTKGLKAKEMPADLFLTGQPAPDLKTIWPSGELVNYSNRIINTTADRNQAKTVVAHTWQIGPKNERKTWEYQSDVNFRWDNGRWRTEWTPQYALPTDRADAKFTVRQTVSAGEFRDVNGAKIGDDMLATLGGFAARFNGHNKAKPFTIAEIVDGQGNVLQTPVTSDGTQGKVIEVMLDQKVQAAAKTAMKGVDGGGLVAIRPSTGGIVALAGPGSSVGVASTGKYAPGSTFKTVTALAMMRAGSAPGKNVECPETILVTGKEFKNASSYPASAIGNITLGDAFAHSCNTVFARAGDNMQSSAVQEAARHLGLGQDAEAGIQAFLGNVPNESTPAVRAAAAIGQGNVLASPLGMATVAASVAAGKTVRPYFMKASKPGPVTDGWNGDHAAELRDMMRLAVTKGTANGLADVPGPPVLAKTGTSEFAKAGTSENGTNGWMIAIQGDLALCVFVENGASGAKAAGPIVHSFLSELNKP